MKIYDHIKQKIKDTILEKLAIQNTLVHHPKYMEKYNYRKQEIKIYTITEKKMLFIKHKLYIQILDIRTFKKTRQEYYFSNNTRNPSRNSQAVPDFENYNMQTEIDKNN